MVERAPAEDLTTSVLTVRLQGAREAINRTRLAFLIATIASLSIFITEWNAYLSWYRRFPLKEIFPGNPVTDEVIRKVLQQYVESRVITISLLGIHVGVSDLAVLGTLALFVCSIWLFFSIRRENHAIGSLLMDTLEASQEVRKYVYYGISSFLVFATSTYIDDPISTLDKKKREQVLDKPQSFASRFLRFALATLFVLPALISISTIVFDILSVYVLQAAFAYPHEPLGLKVLGIHYSIRLLIMELVGIGFFIPTAYLCAKILRFLDSISRIVREYSQGLQ
jgi:hypothetical protein